MDSMRKVAVEHRAVSQWLHVMMGFLVGWSVAGSSEPLVLHIDEEQPPYSIVGDINAGLPPGHITSSFFTHETDGSGMSTDLIIDEMTGIIKTARVLDRETRDKYRFVAVNLGGDTVEVVILVNDINDNAPVFPSSQMRLKISEQTPVGTRFRLDSAIDADRGQFNTQGYFIHSGNVGQSFRLETKRLTETLDLELVVNSPLDREERSTYTLVVEAFDGGTPRKTSQMTLYVSILDVNDNAPLFNQTRYHAIISESLQPGSRFLQVFATDADEGNNAVVIYEINRRQSDPNQYFAIDSKTGIIKLNKGLDYEMKKVHELVVQARDNATHPEITTAFVTVQVKDYNDNQPTLTIIFLSEDGSPHISEGAQPGQFVARISVSDPDYGEYAKVNVSLDGGDGKFGLTTKDNIIYLICVDQMLDREEKDSYQLSVTATDSGTPPLRAESTFTIHVTDVNDNPPVFDHSRYKQSIPEVLYPGSFVLQVTARDKDDGINGDIVYGIVNNPESHSEWFTIDQVTGVITTAATLDYETDPAPTLTVLATDRGHKPLSSSVTVTIAIQDVNDNEPVFSRNFYNTSIKENEPPGTCFLQISATDADSGSFGTVTYSIGSGIGRLPPNQFTIDQHNGQICTSGALDRDEEPDHYEFTVTAVDGGGLNSMAYVKVYVEDINDNRPVFYPLQYAASLSSQSRPGTVVLTVFAYDKDGGRNGKLAYRIVTGNKLALFTLNRGTGVISLASSLRSGGDSVQRLVISAQDTGGLTSLVNAVVNISIVSGSISPPIFEQDQYFLTVAEDTRGGTPIGRVSALNSPGHSDSVFYTISSGDPNGYFAVDLGTGVIRTKAPLDHESDAVVTLDVQAHSGSPPAYSGTKVKITVSDINDNKPTFPTSSESILVPENTELGSVIYSASAEDKDSGANGQVQYDLVTGSHRTFSIDRTSGQLRLIGPLGYETAARYNLEIVAKDSGAPQLSSTFTLLIHVQDESDTAPIFDTLTYRVEVKEGTPVNRRFLQVRALSQDTKGSHVTYHLRPDEDSASFGIVPESGWLFVKSALDREDRDHFSLTVVASSIEGEHTKTGTAMVRISITDENDNTPTLSEDRYFFTAQENVPAAASTIGRVLATDRDQGLNSKLTYRLQPPHANFRINPQTGEMSSVVTFDREVQASYQLTVEVQDGGAPPRSVTASVYVMVLDENDNSPVFTNVPAGEELVLQIFEGNLSGNLVTTLQAKDADEGENGTVVFSLSGSWAQQFSLQPVTGELRSATILRQRDRPEYELLVLAHDRGHPPQTTALTVRVQVLASPGKVPQLDSSSITFWSVEGTVPGSVIGSVASGQRPSAADGEVTYTVVGGTDRDGRFLVDRLGGEVYVAQQLDYESGSHYQLEVAVDSVRSGLPHRSTILLDINIQDSNEHPPLFPEDPITIVINENVPTGSSIYSFHALDQDGSGPNSEVRYTLLTQSPPDPQLQLHPVTGVLAAADTIDRETTATLLLVVQATDQALNASQRKSSAATVRVFVTDENDNSPQFLSPPTVSVLENQPAGSVIGHLVAQDADLGENGRVTYRITSGRGHSHFHLNPDTGALTILDILDCEEQHQFNLTVEVSDHGVPSRKTSQSLQVQVIDVNDQIPTFDQTTYEVAVTENQSPGSPVLQLQAIDRDEGSNGLVTYGAVLDDSFSIDPVSGMISSRGVLDRELQSIHLLTVYAQDGGIPPNVATATVCIRIEDENDNVPQFDKEVYQLQVPENQPRVILFTVKATDKDSSENGRVEYGIVGGDDHGHFSVDRDSGILSTTAGLDREATVLYTLTIAAWDQGEPQHSSSVSVIIHVLDMNDNSPTFPEPSYMAEVGEDSVVGTLVLQVSAVDRDTGSNGQVFYYLSSDSLGMFSVDSVGRVTTAQPLDREKEDTYTFLVRAVDSAPSDPRSSTTRLEVIVKDVNDNSPHFLVDPLVVNISKHTPVHQVVATMKAEDKDFGANASIFYRFAMVVAGFSINSFTGEIRLLSALGPMTQRERTLLVVATDQGTPARSTTGVVNVHLREQLDLGIRFRRSLTDVAVAENTAPGTSVVRVQAQHQNGSNKGIFYSIFSGNERGTFTIRSHTGDISIKSAAGLDFEEGARRRLVIKAESSSSAVFTSVTLVLQDINDNLPLFQQQNYVAFIWEAQGYSTPIMQVLASDVDQGQNGQVTYSIAASPQSELFHINPLTGDISTAAIMDREIWPKTQLRLTATDRGSPRLVGSATLTIVVLDLNDNSPTIPLPQEVRVSENAVIGREITKVTGNDVDSGPVLTYTLLTETHVFSINRYHGLVSLAAALDFEQQSWYLLTVRTSDSKHSTEANITIHVEDVNDNPPLFMQDLYQVLVSEFTPPGTSIVTVTATDRDSGANGQVHYRLLDPEDGLFNIDPHNGTLFTVQPLVAGMSGSLTVLVEARDRGSPALSSRAKVRVQLLDVNDHSPVFGQREYRAEVPEDLRPGSTVLSFEATDADWGPDNGGVDYTIVSGNTANAFQVQSGLRRGAGGRAWRALGRLVLAQRLDFETVAAYNLTIAASDRGVPRRSSTALVLVTVRDVNDNPPVFARSRYEVTVSEAAAVGGELARVWASDRDTGTALRYSISSGDAAGQFAVDERSGVVRLVRALDLELQQRHLLIVQARDGHEPGAHVALVPLAVRVTDVNDNRPLFPVPRLSASVRENLPAGTLVIALRATDRDRGAFGQLRYSLVGRTEPGASQPPLSLHPGTGELRTTRPLDLERRAAVQVVARALDAGNASATVTVTVLVTGEDEYDPVFSQAAYSFAVPGDARRGHAIGRVHATDEDRGLDGAVVYSLLAPSRHFAVNRSTGELLLRVDGAGPREVRATREPRTITLTIAARGPLADARSALTQATVDVSLTSIGLAPEVNPLLVAALAASLGVGAMLAVVGLALVIVRARRKRGLEAEAEALQDKARSAEGSLPPADRIYHQTLPGYAGAPTLVAGAYPRGDSVDPSHSSGRGSAEAADDDEIRMINEFPRLGSALPERVSARGPDSGIQRDADQMSDTSTEPASDWLKPGKAPCALTPAPGGALPGTGIRDCAFPEDGRPAARGSLTAIVASDEELRGSYNWDYLLNWCPQFQPLASVFTEIARLKDESAPRKAATRAGADPRPCIDPPPLITAVAHPSAMSVPPRLAVGRGLGAALPRSPITSDTSIASAAMSPSFSPSLSPLAARSPVVSPFDVSQAPPASLLSTDTSLDSPEEPELRI
ncbi:protocadherin-16 [Amblyraja radiata]|uniref:protocadherin-16 n=1 Tax=Amblyraja radiata TaxID=386614 RepID=UPI0014026176|nr:protocadherin-16 [Amblyraja radiata]XP_032878095.1 protocadherin-16 [Amblyraja radiata]